MSRKPKVQSKFSYISSKLELLSEFGIPITPEIRNRLSDLYPNEIATENYIRSLIIKHLEK